MGALKSIKQETFIQEIIKGNSQRKAYRTAYPSAIKWSDESVDSKASVLFNSVKVVERYNELLKSSVDDSIMTAVERKKFLTNVLKDKLERTDMKLKALDLLNKMDGQYINKVEVSKPTDDTIKEMESYFDNKRRNT